MGILQKIHKTFFQFRRGTAEEWKAKNPVLKQGEPGFAYDKNLFKVGDGETPWNDLKYPGEEDIARVDGNIPTKVSQLENDSSYIAETDELITLEDIDAICLMAPAGYELLADSNGVLLMTADGYYLAVKN